MPALPAHDLKVYYAPPSTHSQASINLGPLIPDVSISIRPTIDALRSIGSEAPTRQVVGFTPAVTHSFVRMDDTVKIADILPPDPDDTPTVTPTGILLVSVGKISDTASDDRVFAMECTPSQKPLAGGPIRLSPATVVSSTIEWIVPREGKVWVGQDVAKADGSAITSKTIPAGKLGLKLTASGLTKINPNSSLSGSGIIMGIVEEMSR